MVWWYDAGNMKLLICTQVVDVAHPILGFFHGWILEFAKHFDRIDVICLEKGEYHLPPHVHVHSLGKEKGVSKVRQLLRFYRYFARTFFSQKPNYVFFHMGAIYNILAAPFFLIRKLYRTQFYWWKTHGKMEYKKERAAFRLCDRVCTAGNSSFKFSAPKVHVVGHAIDGSLFTYRVPQWSSNIRLIAVGRVTPIKKLEVAIDAVGTLTALGVSSHLKIIGPVDDFTYLDQLKRQIQAAQLTNVIFDGPRKQEELVAEYHNADILMHPIYEGGFDKVVLEAMLSGVVPVTSIVSFREILEPLGLFVSGGEVSGYVNAVRYLHGVSVDERNQLTRELREIVLCDHGLHTLSQRIFGVS